MSNQRSLPSYDFCSMKRAFGARERVYQIDRYRKRPDLWGRHSRESECLEVRYLDAKGVYMHCISSPHTDDNTCYCFSQCAMRLVGYSSEEVMGESF